MSQAIIIRRRYRIIRWRQTKGSFEFDYALVDPLGQVVQRSWSRRALKKGGL